MSALRVQVRGRAGQMPIDISLATSDQPLVVVGPNGAGKTTLLLMILGARRPDSGRVSLEGELLFDAELKLDLPVERRGIGFLPQRLGLFPHLDAVHNVAYGILGGSRAERLRRAADVLGHLDAARLARRFPSELSGGEAQRVALARAIASNPRALLLDEPLAALDVPLRRDVRRFLAERLRAWKIPTVLVTHDRADVAEIDGEVVVVERGAVRQRGRLSELAGHPASEFVREFTERR
jgi:molybdate transport system ATP-binding protein